jgi:RNA polymerase sigma-70 factor, ECF subfamily
VRELEPPQSAPAVLDIVAKGGSTLEPPERPVTYDLDRVPDRVSSQVESAVVSRSSRAKKRDEFTAEQLEVLVEKAKTGDLPSFQELYDGYAKKILNYVYRMTGSREEAEDLAQDTFILAYKNIKNLKENAKFQSWLYRIAQNNVYQKYRTRLPRMESIEGGDDETGVMEMPSGEKTPEGVILSEELQGVIKRVIDELPEKYRQVFVLSAIQKQSYEAIAEIVGRSLASVKSDIHRARVEVRDRVKKYLGENYGMSGVHG